MHAFLSAVLNGAGILMAEQIRHEGVVLSIKGDMAQVQIVQSSACSACVARKTCLSAEQQEKRMDALMLEPLQVGDRVEVLLTERLGWKAVLLAYIMPFVVMMIVIALLGLWSSNEVLVGTLSLVAVAIYYIILSFFRNRLQKQFSFTAQKIRN